MSEGTFRMLLRALHPAFVALLLAGCGGSPELASPQGPVTQRFQAELDAMHAEFGFPGATAAFVLPDGTTGVAVTGLADVESGIRMTTESRMLAGSIGKTFVGAEVLALAQEKKLGLDDPVSKWLGDRPWFGRLPNRDGITVRHLLTHSAGLIDHVHDEAFAAAIAGRWQKTDDPFPPEALVDFALDKKPLNEPGKGWEYSDTGYLLLGLIIEKAAGRTFYDEVARRFLVPLGLRATEPSNRTELAGLASGYTQEGNPLGLPRKTTLRPGVLVWNPAVEWTGGGFISTPRDLATWAKALYEGKALSGDYRAELFNSVPVVGFPITLVTGKIRYGAGVAIYEKTPFGPKYGHGGGIPGYTSSMRFYPARGFAVAFQVNSDVDTDDFAEAMEDRLAMVIAESLKRKP